MYDLSMPNEKPGQCCKCKGTGTYTWQDKAASLKARRPVTQSGTCYSCGGTGNQTKRDNGRNHAYNRHKIASLAI